MMINALYSFGIIKYHTYIEYSRDLNKNKEAPHWLSQISAHYSPSFTSCTNTMAHAFAPSSKSFTQPQPFLATTLIYAPPPYYPLTNMQSDTVVPRIPTQHSFPSPM